MKSTDIHCLIKQVIPKIFSSAVRFNTKMLFFCEGGSQNKLVVLQSKSVLNL